MHAGTDKSGHAGTAVVVNAHSEVMDAALARKEQTRVGT